MEKVFLSYSRSNTDFVLRLAGSLKKEGIDIWLDQTDIHPGSRWDVEIEKALDNCNTILVVISPDSVSSQNVLDEVSYGIEEGKRIIPVLLEDCKIPFRLRRFQYTDFTNDFEAGFPRLMENFEVVKSNLQPPTLKKSGTSEALKPPLPKVKKASPVSGSALKIDKIAHSIESALENGGDGNFIYIGVDPFKNYYMQIVAGNGDKEIYAEIVGNTVLEAPYQFTPSEVNVINELGWKENGEVNFNQRFSVIPRSEFDKAVKAISIALIKVFGVKSEEELEIELNLE